MTEGALCLISAFDTLAPYALNETNQQIEAFSYVITIYSHKYLPDQLGISRVYPIDKFWNIV